MPGRRWNVQNHLKQYQPTGKLNFAQVIISNGWIYRKNSVLRKFKISTLNSECSLFHICSLIYAGDSHFWDNKTCYFQYDLFYWLQRVSDSAKSRLRPSIFVFCNYKCLSFMTDSEDGASCKWPALWWCIPLCSGALYSANERGAISRTVRVIRIPMGSAGAYRLTQKRLNFAYASQMKEAALGNIRCGRNNCRFSKQCLSKWRFKSRR